MNNFPFFNLNKKITALAPIDGFTDCAFREIVAKVSKPDIMFTEFVHSRAVIENPEVLIKTFRYTENQRPIIAQIFGTEPKYFYKTSIILCLLGFNGIDINMGCPAKTVTHHGSGAALIDKPDLAVKIIQSVKRGISDWFTGKTKITDLKLNQKTLEVIGRNQTYSQTNRHIKKTNLPPTISVKTRLGIDQSIIETWAEILLNQNLDFLTIHGRTLKQAYSGQANWSEIKKVVDLAKNTKTKVLGNGDITSRCQGLEYCQKYGVDGVLIGRAAGGNPWCFSNHLATPQEKFSAMLLHAQIFSEVFPQRCFDSLRKHFLLYTAYFPHAKSLRMKLVRLNSVKELLSLESEFQS